MTSTQKKLRELRERQSKERGRMAELAIADNLTDETRAELDAIETGTPDLERQLRAATGAVETEEAEQREAGAAGDTPAGDTENRECLELRKKVRMSNYILAAMSSSAQPSDAEHEYNAAIGITGRTASRSNCWRRPNSGPRAPRNARRQMCADIQTMPRTWLDRLCSPRLPLCEIGITMESVPVGSASYPRHHGRRLRCAASTDDRRGRRCRMDNRRKGVEAETKRRAAFVLD